MAERYIQINKLINTHRLLLQLDKEKMKNPMNCDL